LKARLRLIALFGLLAAACKRHPDANATPAPAPSEERAPKPEDLTLVDEQHKELNVVILIVGDGADRFVTTTASRFDAGSAPIAPGSMTYLPLSLGDIRGWKPLLHLYAYPRGTFDSAQAHVARADGVIVVEFEPGKSRGRSAERHAWSKFAAATGEKSTFRSHPPSVGVLGSRDLQDDWTSHGGPEPVDFAGALDSEVFPMLKEVSKAVLKQLKKGD
jgi:hypothetical protein